LEKIRHRRCANMRARAGFNCKVGHGRLFNESPTAGDRLDQAETRDATCKHQVDAKAKWDAVRAGPPPAEQAAR